MSISRKPMKSIAWLLGLTMVAAAGCASTGPAEGPGSSQSNVPLADGAVTMEEASVYMLVPDAKIARYQQFDAPAIEKWLKVYAPNFKLTVLDSEGNAQKQVQQVEGAISDQADAMILLPVDSNTAGGMLSALKEEQILTLTYAHEGFGGPVDYHVTTPFPTIAENHAQHLEKYMTENKLDRPYRIAALWGQPGFAFYTDLKNTYKPYLDKWAEQGLAEVVYEADTNGWSSEASQPVMEQALTKTENNIDVVLTMNDDLGTGIIAALNAQGLAGKVVLAGGCDATREGIARVQAGWQSADISMDYDKMGEAAAKLVAYRLSGQDAPAGLVNGTFDNKFVEGGVPAVLVPALLITEDNIKERIVDTGMYTQAQIDETAAGMK